MAVNTGNVIKGGLLAGLVANALGYLAFGVVLKAPMDDATKALNPALLDKMNATPNMVVGILGGFVTGILMVWTYAAIRGTYGPGPGTAARAGLLWWFAGALIYLNQSLGGMWGMHLFYEAAAIQLVCILIAINAGAWLYKE